MDEFKFWYDQQDVRQTVEVLGNDEARRYLLEWTALDCGGYAVNYLPCPDDPRSLPELVHHER